MDEIWNIERQLWLDGVAAYSEHMARECLMVFGPMGILTRDLILDSLKEAPRWTEVEMTDMNFATTGDVSVLGYRAKAMRDGDEPYSAVCSSSYVQEDGRWKIIQHQQTPLGR